MLPHSGSGFKDGGASRPEAYRLPVTWIAAAGAPVPAAARRLAATWWPRLGLTGYKRDGKQEFLGRLLAAGLAAVRCGAAVAVGRRHGAAGVKKAEIGVVDAAVAAGLFAEHRSPKGSPQMSRLLPGRAFHSSQPVPAPAATPAARPLVIIHKRHTTETVPFDPHDPTARHYAAALEQINGVNATHAVTAALGRRGRVRLDTRLRAIFTDSLAAHGRMYTEGALGYQQLSEAERVTVLIDGGATAELDYQCYHARMAYHLSGVEPPPDAYAVEGRGATASPPDRRVLVKRLLLTLLNARSPARAVAACNGAMRARTPSGRRKVGREADEARELREAVRRAGVTFKQLLPEVVRAHAPIRSWFGTDAGLRLMRIDSEIALAVVGHFTARGECCLPVHDSFIVRRALRAELLSVMQDAYREKVGKWPVVRGAGG
jgi:hypothetical protein